MLFFFCFAPHASVNSCLHSLKKKNEFDKHVAVPPRCTFNSFGKFLPPGRKYEKAVENLQQQSWYMSEAYYHKGDLVAHVAGVDNKIDTLKLLLAEAE